jgi:hypothetical protein
MNVDLITLITTVRKIAAKYPDAIYKRGETKIECYYSKGISSTPSNKIPGKGCLIGRALREMRQKVDPSSEGEVVASFINYTTDEYPYMQWLEQLQMSQDAQREWRNAVEIADIRFPDGSCII